jgi:hypothetical protein
MALIHNITAHSNQQQRINLKAINERCLSLAELWLILHRAFFRTNQLSFNDNCELILKPFRQCGSAITCITLGKNHTGRL